MTLSPDQAADALRDIAAIQAHSQRIYGYRHASPHLILWGLLWAVGYGLIAIIPLHRGLIWIAIVPIGMIAGFLIERRAALRQDAQADPTQRRSVARLRRLFNGTALIAFAFITATCVVMSPVTPRQVGAFIPLVVAASYAVLGLWIGARFIAVGAVLAALTVSGFLVLPAHFEPWMAAVGGGALVLGGLWLRQV